MVSFDTAHEPPAVAVPVDLAEALAASSEAGAVFAGLARSHRKEYVDWIVEAKRPETRERRIARTIEMLLDDGHQGARG